MKRKIFHFLTIVTLLSAVTVSCKKDSTVNGIFFENANIELFVGEKTTIKPTVVPKSAKVSLIWESSDTTVASVINGKLTALAFGKTTVTVKTKDNSHTAKCFVTVIQIFEPAMVPVEGGTFTMGCTDDNCSSDGREEPAHKVTLSSFSIAKYPVTQKEYFALMGDNPSYNQSSVNLPVERVSYANIQKYIQKLNEYTGKKYRLPTEAEWEYAARGGIKRHNYSYSGSDFVDLVAWIDGTTHPVGLLAPNELEIFDMSGNVFEICSDWFGFYKENDQTNPQGPPSSTFGRVIRGGNYKNIAYYCRIAFRMNDSNYVASNLGFRLVHP